MNKTLRNNLFNCLVSNGINDYDFPSDIGMTDNQFLYKDDDVLIYHASSTSNWLYSIKQNKVYKDDSLLYENIMMNLDIY